MVNHSFIYSLTQYLLSANQELGTENINGEGNGSSWPLLHGAWCSTGKGTGAGVIRYSNEKKPTQTVTGSLREGTASYERGSPGT